MNLYFHNYNIFHAILIEQMKLKVRSRVYIGELTKLKTLF